MDICEKNHFPCFHVLPKEGGPQYLMEIIANVKLYDLSIPVTVGVNIYFVDLDVGFKVDPLSFVRPLSEPTWDIQFQLNHFGIKDLHDAYHGYWMNIGLLYIRATPLVRKVFDFAWELYQVND